MSGWGRFHNFKQKPCAVCETLFTPKSGVNKFCSTACKGKWKYITGSVTTATQYAYISGNWTQYVSRLLYHGGRKRDRLDRDALLRVLERQSYKCALSGVPLTCKLESGTQCPTNASVDRIVAGGPYIEGNIQIVCRALNSWRNNVSVEDFIWWCRQVTNHNTPKLRSKEHEKTT